MSDKGINNTHTHTNMFQSLLCLSREFPEPWSCNDFLQDVR